MDIMLEDGNWNTIKSWKQKSKKRSFQKNLKDTVGDDIPHHLQSEGMTTTGGEVVVCKIRVWIFVIIKYVRFPVLYK